jgi:hypothetical protein
LFIVGLNGIKGSPEHYKWALAGTILNAPLVVLGIVICLMMLAGLVGFDLH